MVDGKVGTANVEWRGRKVGVPEAMLWAPLDVERPDVGVGRVVA